MNDGSMPGFGTPRSIAHLSVRGAVWKEVRGETVLLTALARPTGAEEVETWNSAIGLDPPYWPLLSVEAKEDGLYELSSEAHDVVGMGAYLRGSDADARTAALSQRLEERTGGPISSTGVSAEEIAFRADGELLVSTVPWLQIPNARLSKNAQIFPDFPPEPSAPEGVGSEAATLAPDQHEILQEEETLPPTAPTPKVRRRLRFWPLAVTTVLTAVLLAGWFAWRLQVFAQVAPDCTEAVASQTLENLLAKRTEALIAADPAKVAKYATGAALAADEEFLGKLIRGRESIEGAAFAVINVSELRCGREGWRGSASVRQEAFRYCRAGACQEIPAAVTTLKFHLVSKAGVWLIEEAEPEAS